MARIFNPLIRDLREIPFQRRIEHIFPFNAAPTYTTKTTGATLTPYGQRLFIDTITAGANKICEFYEYWHGYPFSRDIGVGANWGVKYHYLEARINDAAQLGTSAGEAYWGITIGSRKATTPWTGAPLVQAPIVQLRWNDTLQQLEASIYSNDASGVNTPVVQVCERQENSAGLFAIEYYPNAFIRFYINNELVHTYDNKEVMNNLYTGIYSIGDDAGFGGFVTGGSDASGRMQAAFEFMRGVTVI